jgi:hypothetical protein
MLFLSGRVVPAGDAQLRDWDHAVDLALRNELRNGSKSGWFRGTHPGAPQANRSSGVGPCGLLTIPWRVPVWPHEPLSRRGPGNDEIAPVCLRTPAESSD